MKTKQVLILALLAFCTLHSSLSTAKAQGTAFSYEGQLQTNGPPPGPANGNYDFEFSLYPNAAGTGSPLGTGTATQTAIGVSNGLFTTTLNFGAVFTGNATWLAISVRSNNVGSYTALTPLQELTPTPYAIYTPNAGSAATATTAGSANSVAAANITGTVSLAQLPATVVTNTETGVTLGGTFGGNGSGLTSLNASQLSSGVVPTSVLPGFQSPNYETVGGGSGNTANNTYATVGGGGGNTAGYLATVPGGIDNTASGYYSFAAGNNAQATHNGAFVWADGEGASFGSTTTNQFNVRANGGARFVTSGAGLTLDGNAVLTNNESGLTLSGAFSGNGGGLTNLNAAQLTGFTAATPPASGYPILNMVWIVPGTFVMGAPTSDPDYQSDETQHVVTLTNGFWMGQHPVTQGEYLAVMGNNPSSFTGDLTRPVESVSWFNATNFCYVLTQNEQSAGRLPTGWVYRLPTESEWEYCCRALTTSRYYFGNDPGDGTSLTNYAWYTVNSGGTTQPVGQLLPNTWGLVDMAGNVFEWCQDWYGTYPTANVSYNPQGPASGSYRVFRGGSSDYPAFFCRSALRSYGPTYVYSPIGFRVVLAPGQ